MLTHTSDLGNWIAGASLLMLAVLHSFLGEKHLVGPLLASPGFPALATGRELSKRVLRMAWHLTSLAWLALAYLLVSGQCAALPVAACLAASGALTHLSTGGRHFAWAVFMLGALAAASSGWSGTSWPALTGLVAATTLAAIGCMHVAWAFGVGKGTSAAIPEQDGKPLFAPPVGLTLLVALGLFAASWLTLALSHWVPAPLPASWLWAAGSAAALVFAARTVGDLRFVGLFKRVHGSRFARMDDALFTPICFGLSVAITMQLL